MSQLSGARRNGVLSAIGLAAVFGIAELTLASAQLSSLPGASGPLVVLGLLGLLAVASTLLWHFGREAQLLGFAEPAKGFFERSMLSFSAVLLVMHLAMSAAYLLHSVSLWLQAGLLAAKASYSQLPWMAEFLPYLLLVLVVSMVIMGFPGVGRAAFLLATASLFAGLLQVLLNIDKAPPVFSRQHLSFGTFFIVAIALMPFASLASLLRSPRRRSMAAGFATIILLTSFAALRAAGLAKTMQAPGLVAFALILALSLSLLLAVILFFAVVYALAAGLERQGLLPAWLIKSNSKSGAAIGIVVVMFVLIGGFIALQLWGKDISSSAFVHADLTLGALALAALVLRIVIKQHSEQLAYIKWIAVYAFLASAVFAVWMLWLGGWLSWTVAVAALFMTLILCVGSRINARLPHLRATTVEQFSAVITDEMNILTLHEAEQLMDTHHARVMVASLVASPAILQRAMMRAEDEKSFYLLYVDELPGLFYPPQVEPSIKARALLQKINDEVSAKGFEVIPIWRVAHDPAASIAQAAKNLQIDRVIVNPQGSRPLAEILHGQTLGRLRKLLGKVALEVVRSEDVQKN